MALKFVLDSIDDLDEALKGLYSKHTDGKFYLDVEGAVAKAKVDEFRDNNVSLKKQVEDLTDKYGNVDLTKYQELLDAAAADDGKKNITMEKVDEIVAERTKAMKAEHKNQLEALGKSKDGISKQLDGLLIDGSVRTAAMDAKVRSGALEDVVLRAKQTFKVVDGKAVAHDAEGAVIYGKDGSNPLSTVEWIGGLKTSATHLFEQSKGGGAGDGDKKPTGDNQNQDAATMSPLQKISAGMTASE